jgi:WD40 repeat protein
MDYPTQSDWRHERSTPYQLMEGFVKGVGILGGTGLMFILLAWIILGEEPQTEDEHSASTPTRAEPIYEIQLNEPVQTMLVRTPGNLLLCDSRTGILIRAFPDLNWWQAKCVAWVPGSHRFLVGCRNGRLMLMDSRSSHEVVFSAKAHEEDIRSAAISADGAIAATASQDRICLWDLKQHRLIKQIPAQGMMPKVLQFSPDQTQLLLGCSNGSLRAFGTDDLDLKLHIQPDFKCVMRVLCIEQGQKIMWGDIGGEVFICEAATGQICSRFTPCSNLHDMAVSADERLIGFAGYNHVIHLYSLETLKKITSLEGHSSGVTSLQFSEDEAWLYSASWDGTFRIWDAKAFTELAAFGGTAPSNE